MSIIDATVFCMFTCAPVSGGPIGKAVDHRIPVYEVRDLPIEDALKRLVGERGRTFVIGFEQTSMTGTTEPRINLTVEQNTVGEILKAICSQDPRYTFSEPEDGVLNVFPAVEPADARAILDLTLSQVDIAVRDWPFNLFARISEFAPDLRKYLEMRAEEYRAGTLSRPPGSPGVTMTNDVEPPQIEIHLRQTTVRGALNAIAAFTLTHSFSDQTPTVVLEPTGWKFWFQTDTHAATGLGGYPHWEPF